jgi:hypothetical protein
LYSIVRVAAVGVVATISHPVATSAEVINRGIQGAPMSEIRPAPKSIYPDQKVITAQPSPKLQGHSLQHADGVVQHFRR